MSGTDGEYGVSQRPWRAVVSRTWTSAESRKRAGHGPANRVETVEQFGSEMGRVVLVARCRGGRWPKSGWCCTVPYNNKYCLSLGGTALASVVVPPQPEEECCLSLSTSAAAYQYCLTLS
eukprot:637182-Rhodomonas_salina.1